MYLSEYEMFSSYREAAWDMWGRMLEDGGRAQVTQALRAALGRV